VETLKHFLNFVYRQYGLVIQVIMVDNEGGLDEDFDAVIAEEGIAVEHSPPLQHEPNGAIERAGGLLTQRATALKISGKLPDKYRC
jgi:hypothetical protein